ncbi:MAG: TerC family protein [Chthoniobacterales bacterium]
MHSECLNTLTTLFLLIALEIVLGVDNIVVISLLVARLPEKIRQQARITGLLFALFFRLGFVAGAFYLVKLTTPLFGHFSVRDFIFLAGGCFLFWKACRELYLMIECKEPALPAYAVKKIITMAIVQIVMLDILFSIDSVITAVGLTTHLSTIFIAVIFSFSALLFYVGPVGEFILRHVSLKILALSFLVMIGVSLVMEGLGHPLHRKILYFSMSFAFLVEVLQMRYHKKRMQHKPAISQELPQ